MMLEVVEVKDLLNFLKTRDEAFVYQLQLKDDKAIYYEVYPQGNRDVFFFCIDKYYPGEYIRISNGQIVESTTMDSAHSFGIVHIKGDTLLGSIMLAGALNYDKMMKMKKSPKTKVPVKAVPKKRGLPKSKSA